MAVDMQMPILVVDDYKCMVRTIQNLLKQLGFTNLDEAGSGEQAMEKLKAAPFSLVISDWRMEPVDGLQLLKSMRADDELRDTPFIMVTAESVGERVFEAKLAKVDNYIVKPFTAATLKRRLAAVLGDF
jgi:two-component system chemotaxis response regulator CheY